MRVVSLFAGIGGFDLAFSRCGMRTVAVVECDKNCRKLLNRHFPDALQFDDVRTVGKHNLPECDLLCGGFPCQDLSQAGKRAGLAGARSGLFYEFMRIVWEIAPAYVMFENVAGLLSGKDEEDGTYTCVHCGAAGWRRLLSNYTLQGQEVLLPSGIHRDDSKSLDDLEGCSNKIWGGAKHSSGSDGEVVGGMDVKNKRKEHEEDTGRCCSIFNTETETGNDFTGGIGRSIEGGSGIFNDKGFEQKGTSCCGHASKEAWYSCPVCGGTDDDPSERAELVFRYWMGTVVRSFQQLGYSGAWRTFDAQYFGVAQRRRRVFGVFSRLDSGAERCAEILSLREGVRGHPAPSREAGEGVAGTLTGGASGGSSHGKKSGTDREGFLIVGTLESRTTGGGFPGTVGACAGHVVAECSHASGDYVEDGTASAMKARDFKDATDLIVFSSKDHGADAGPIASMLRSMNFDASHINGGGQVAVAFKPSHYTRGKDGAPSSVMPPLSADADKGDKDPVIFQSRIARNGRGQPDAICPALNGSNAGATSDMRPLVAVKTTVRRLTPVECERLQGFPDRWTEGFSDSVRYRMLGNAVAVPVVEWIGHRIRKDTPNG